MSEMGLARRTTTTAGNLTPVTQELARSAQDSTQSAPARSGSAAAAPSHFMILRETAVLVHVVVRPDSKVRATWAEDPASWSYSSISYYSMLCLTGVTHTHHLWLSMVREPITTFSASALGRFVEAQSINAAQGLSFCLIRTKGGSYQIAYDPISFARNPRLSIWPIFRRYLGLRPYDWSNSASGVYAGSGKKPTSQVMD